MTDAAGIAGDRWARRVVAATAVLGLALASGAARAAPISKGPYLQSLGRDGVTVKVELEAAAPAALYVYAAGTERRVAGANSLESRDFHALRASGLEPGTTYDYRVVSDDATSELGHFTTAPAGDAPFRFLVYGDSRSDHAAHEAVARALASAPGEFLINTGDMVLAGKDPADWAAFFRIEGPLLRDHCVFACVGNHELSRGDPAGEVAFLRYFSGADENGERTRLYGSFRWSNTRFFLLNAMDTWTGEERDWLRNELDRAMYEPGLVHRVAVLHHGPFSSGPHGANPALASAGITNLMATGRIDLVLAGHDHVYERGDGEGLKYIISGGAGAPVYEHKLSAPQTMAFESVHHFVEAAIDGPSVKIVARRVDGSVIESCGFRGAGPWECDTPAARPPPALTPTLTPAPSSAPEPPPRRSCGCSVPGDSGVATGPLAAAIGLLGLLARRRRRLRATGK
ncbi:MAG: metallophosphoesterase [Byssovorax sp.]